MIIDWKELSKEELDHHLSPTQWSNRPYSAADVLQHFKDVMLKGSEETQRCFDSRLNIPYGDQKLQKIDIYQSVHPAEDAPVLVVLHGGYWQQLCKELYGSVAMQPVKHGAVVAVVGYSIAPEGRLRDMINETEQALVFLAKRFPHSRGFYLSGHSAGGQLGAMMLSVDWSKKYSLPNTDFIKGCCMLSGVFDMHPIVGSYVNDCLHLTEKEATEASPLSSINLSEALRLSPHCRVINVCGEYDPPLFIQMMTEYTKALASGGFNASCSVISNMDHFEPVERLADAEHCVTKMLLDLMSI